MRLKGKESGRTDSYVLRSLSWVGRERLKPRRSTVGRAHIVDLGRGVK